MASANNIGTLNRSLPCQIVPTADRKMSPAGIEISSVEARNGLRSTSGMPLVNMWCAQTTAERPAMPHMPPTAHL